DVGYLEVADRVLGGGSGAFEDRELAHVTAAEASRSRVLPEQRETERVAVERLRTFEVAHRNRGHNHRGSEHAVPPRASGDGVARDHRQAEGAPVAPLLQRAWPRRASGYPLPPWESPDPPWSPWWSPWLPWSCESPCDPWSLLLPSDSF